jgi:proteasome lid subunit RPN8/RPN11
MEGSRSLSVPRLDREALHLITRIGRSRAPAEACGLLLIDPSSPDRVIELANRAMDPTRRYEFNSGDVIIALENNDIDPDSYQGELVIWHTHPGGSIGPSMEDLQQKVEGVPFLVVALLDDGTEIIDWF